ncbi:MAG: heavy-metal-associated domain-containing protein [Planctomycetaceae bacterium]
MRAWKMQLLCAASLMISASAATAGGVTVEGAHLCCGACVKAATAAFEGVDGVSNVAIDKDAGTIKFDVTNVKAARSGLGALAKAGFGGAAKHEGKDLKFPKGFKEDGKANSVTIRGVHNCCPGCAKAIEGALKGVKGVDSVKCQKKSCTVTGTDIAYSDLVQALHAEGLHGSIPAPKAK